MGRQRPAAGSGALSDIEKRMAVLNEQMKEAEGSPTEYEKEIEELKELLPEIREKIEDAKESQRSGNVAELALKATLVESSIETLAPERPLKSGLDQSCTSPVTW